MPYIKMPEPRKRVAHFIRKDAQLKASFIRNQIANHVRYNPILIWRKERPKRYDGGYARFDTTAYPTLNLSEEEGWREKALFIGPKVLSARQVDKILHTLDKNEVSVCHFHYGSDCGIFSPLLTRLKIPSVVSFYGYDCSSFPGRYLGYGKVYLQKRVFADISAVLAMSEDMRNDLIRLGCPKEKIIVHYYGSEVKRFFMVRPYDRKESIELLILASLVPQKGHMTLLKSLVRLIASGVSNFTLRIVGTGELENQLKSYVLRNNLSQHVVFTGPIPYASQEMMAEYRRADIFIHPSVEAANGDKEGIPGTIVEAMASGLPVVSTYHAGIPYIITDHYTGLLVKEYDIEALSHSIHRLMTELNLRKRIGLAGQQYASEYLDITQKEIDLEKIYDDVITNARKRRRSVSLQP
jgi:colanic acid/amylovoran biosynthesis glycosyltransferase